MTPYELGLFIEHHNEKIKFEVEEKITLVYLGAAWQRAKTMPSLDSILNKKPQRKQMTNEEMLEKVKHLNAAFGGATY
ncbi:hypothetical protein [Bacillus sp. OK048]|uniref:hypothetical protein n=1 Tax=Bacillus sp. OK048 TaxID=1882761 RepID=UPI00088D2FCD|nr:hypothetical protein [Bacillus sp. OK048]SDM17347.1 hypothetical protein SAMN05443253_102164 [Bacillus sp. OK048]